MDDRYPVSLGQKSFASELDPRGVVLAYARVSTEVGGQADGVSIENQIDKCLLVCAGKPVKIIAYDKGISGSIGRDGRPALNYLLENAKHGNILVCHSLSRLTRTAGDGLLYINDLTKRGVGVVVCDDDINTTTPDGYFKMTIMLAVYELERKLTGKRVKEGMAKRKALAGDAWTTNERYGYQWGEPDEKGKKGALVPYEPEHAILRKILAEAIKQPPPTLKALAEMANSIEGNTRKWWPDNIKKLLDAEGIPSKKSARKTGTTGCIPPHEDEHTPPGVATL